MKSTRCTRPLHSPPRPGALLVLCALLCFAGANAAHAQLKVGVVDVKKIFENYYKTKENIEKIKAARAVTGKQLDDRLDTHHRLLEETARLEKEIVAATNPEAKADRQRARDDNVITTHSLETETQDFRATSQRSLQELTVRLRTQIVEDIMLVVNARIETNHYDLILNASAQVATGLPLVLSASPSLDMTDDILSTLNRDHPMPPTPSPVPAVAPKPAGGNAP